MSTSSYKAGNPAAQRTVLIIHGYTGSPDEFKELAHELASRLDAYVEVPLLPGHGTDEEDLLHYSLDDLVDYVDGYAQKMSAEGKSYVIIGHSMGAHLALLAAAKYPPKAVVATVMPYLLKRPFSIPGAEWYARRKKMWDKPLSEKELDERKEHFYYKRMPGIALSLLKDANSRVATILSKITCPILTINNRADPMSHHESGETIITKSAHNPKSKSVVLEKDEHGLFYGPSRDEVIKIISDFLVMVMGK